jgi:hypothetical protein
MENGSKLWPHIGVLLSLAGVYVAVLSALYLYGYWGAFNLNVFEYLTLTDLLTHAIFALFPVMIPSVFVWLFIGVLWVLSPRHPWPAIVAETKPSLWKGLAAIAIFIVMWAAWQYLPRAVFWYVLWVLAIVLTVLVVDDFGKVLPNPYLSWPVLVAAIWFPLSAYDFGLLSGLATQRGYGNSLYVDMPGSGLQLVDKQYPQHLVRYLGRLGDSYILYEPTSGQLAIVRTDKVPSLVLMSKPAK